MEAISFLFVTSTDGDPIFGITDKALWACYRYHFNPRYGIAWQVAIDIVSGKNAFPANSSKR
jgi:hypothetical protein